MKKMNIPNILSLIRVLLVPLFVLSLLFMDRTNVWGFIVPALIYTDGIHRFS